MIVNWNYLHPHLHLQTQNCIYLKGTLIKSHRCNNPRQLPHREPGLELVKSIGVPLHNSMKKQNKTHMHKLAQQLVPNRR